MQTEWNFFLGIVMFFCMYNGNVSLDGAVDQVPAPAISFFSDRASDQKCKAVTWNAVTKEAGYYPAQWAQGRLILSRGTRWLGSLHFFSGRGGWESRVVLTESPAHPRSSGAQLSVRAGLILPSSSLQS